MEGMNESQTETQNFRYNGLFQYMKVFYTSVVWDARGDQPLW